MPGFGDPSAGICAGYSAGLHSSHVWCGGDMRLWWAVTSVKGFWDTAPLLLGFMWCLVHLVSTAKLRNKMQLVERTAVVVKTGWNNQIGPKRWKLILKKINTLKPMYAYTWLWMGWTCGLTSNLGNAAKPSSWSSSTYATWPVSSLYQASAGRRKCFCS